MKKAYVLMADGFEEIEAFTSVDVLRRAGVSVVMTAVSQGEIVTGAHGVSVLCDKNIDSCDFFDADLMLLPGGMPGAQNLADNERLCSVLQTVAANGKTVAAICAAPMVLGKAGLLKGKKATCYPGFEKCLIGAECTGASVQKDGEIITGKGPGVSMEFALAIVKHVVGAEKAQELRAEMMCSAK